MYWLSGKKKHTAICNEIYYTSSLRNCLLHHDFEGFIIFTIIIHPSSKGCSIRSNVPIKVHICTMRESNFLLIINIVAQDPNFIAVQENGMV